MYFPLSQITTNLYTSGGELKYADPSKNNEFYTGNYFKTSNNKYFTGKTPQDVPTDELFLTRPNINSNAPLDSLSVNPANAITCFSQENKPKANTNKKNILFIIYCVTNDSILLLTCSDIKISLSLLIITELTKILYGM